MLCFCFHSSLMKFHCDFIFDPLIIYNCFNSHTFMNFLNFILLLISDVILFGLFYHHTKTRQRHKNCKPMLLMNHKNSQYSTSKLNPQHIKRLDPMTKWDISQEWNSLNITKSITAISRNKKNIWWPQSMKKNHFTKSNILS